MEKVNSGCIIMDTFSGTMLRMSKEDLYKKAQDIINRQISEEAPKWNEYPQFIYDFPEEKE